MSNWMVIFIGSAVLMALLGLIFLTGTAATLALLLCIILLLMAGAAFIGGRVSAEG